MIAMNFILEIFKNIFNVQLGAPKVLGAPGSDLPLPNGMSAPGWLSLSRQSKKSTQLGFVCVEIEL